MLRFRYRLSWLLLVPVLLAATVWWCKPPAHASYNYLAENGPAFLPRVPSFYDVKQVYLDQQLLLYEIKDCDYAIIYIGADWSPNAKITIQQLRKASEHYQGRVPMFICGYVADEFLGWFPGTSINYRYSDSYLCIVQRGVITHQYYDYLGSPDEIHMLLKQILPWNYWL